MTKKYRKHTSRWLLAAALLLGSSALWAIDTDGDGIPDKFGSISAGNRSTCALDDNGVHCWGFNSTVPALSHPTAVSSGDSHTCALDDTGVVCWGSNFAGKTTVPALSHPTAVSTGKYHTCALDDSGVHCWGAANGTGTNVGQTTVPALSHPTAVSTGDFHTCALDDNGVHCWGAGSTPRPNADYCTGYDQDCGQSIVPALSHPVAVSAGAHHTCALDDSGVVCWGAGASNTIYSSSPNYDQSKVPALSHPVAVSAGAYHTCALDDSGVVCWGNQETGAAAVPTLSHPWAVSAGGSHTCALDDSGAVCWGVSYPNYGQTTVPAGLSFTLADSCPYVANLDQLDTDGDGIGDACDPNPSLPAVAIPDDVNGAAKADKTGTTVAVAGDFNGDGYGDYVIGSPNANKGAGRVDVISGKDGSPLFAMNGDIPKGAFGFAIAGGKDIDGDSFDDVVIGSPKANKITVLYGCAGVDCATTEDIGGTEAKSAFGSAVALGDVNNDSHADIIVGAPNATNVKLKKAGSVTVLDGTNLNNALDTFHGMAAGALAGTAVAAANVDGNAGDEVIIGAPNDIDAGQGKQRLGSMKVYLHGAEDDSPDIKKYGTNKSQFGKAVASGDVNNDGSADVLVGAPQDDDLTNKRTDAGSITVFSGSSGVQLTKKYGVTAKASLGNSIAVGDVNGDGKADVIAGAWKDDKPTANPKKPVKDVGSVSVFSGNGFAPLGTQYGAVAKDYFGTAVAAGDINGDGKADLIIGIPGFDAAPVPPAKKPTADVGKVKVLSGAGL